MRRSKRLRGQDYYENDEILEETEAFEEYDETDVDYDEEYDDEEPNGSGVGKKIITILIIIVALIALFFASTKVTEILLDYNNTPENYESTVPDLDEDEVFESMEPDIPEISAEPTHIGAIESIGGDSGSTATKKPSASSTASAKPSAAATEKPAVSESAPSSAKPTPAAPVETQKPSKPVIIPGNPAAN